jgi:uncharacterized coiled-coil protein SlyX
MTLDDIEKIIAEGGWIILVVYFLYKEVWPLITGKLIPASMKKAEADRLERVLDLEDERQFRREMEQERSKTLAAISQAISNLSVSMTQTNERIAAILTNQQLIISQQTATFGVLTEAVGDMKAATARRASDFIPPMTKE